jgi:hypothetical protein
VPKEKLFLESDLSGEKNIVKVISCVEALEKLAVSKGFAIPIERIPEDHVRESFVPKYNELHRWIMLQKISKKRKECFKRPIPTKTL